ncbi:MAG: hypothetical protein ABJG15_08395 [Hyphomonadaceae bacterium]
MNRVATSIAAIGGLIAGGLAGFLIWGTNGQSDVELSDAPIVQDLASTPDIASTDFAILPCQERNDPGGCVIIAAGGKRVLVDAPSGVGRGQGSDALGTAGFPDAILLFALDAVRIEGLDEIRNKLWESGAVRPVPLIGGEGIEEIGSGLDQTYIVPDAVSYISGRRQGGFDSTPLLVRAVRDGDVAFDTGDLKIWAMAGGVAQIAYRIEYAGSRVILADCGADSQTVQNWPEVDHYVGCADVPEQIGSEENGKVRSVDWPLREPVFIITSN